MSEKKNLLVELLVEELPPKALQKLGEAFGSRVAEELVSTRSVEPEDADRRKVFASPRRLAVFIPGVYSTTAQTQETTRLMPKKVAFAADGITATPALHKKLRPFGYPEGTIPHADLLVKVEGGAEVVYLNQVIAGRELEANLQQALDATLKTLPIPKVMQYQLADGWTSVNFVRPARGLVALHGDEIMERVSVLGLKAGGTTKGHRFEAKAPQLVLRNADSYAEQLRDEGAVIASYADRRAEIARQLAEAATKEGLKAIDDEDLLNEVTALVERPKVLVCRFDESFLDVPPECLILTMKANQKYFPLLNAANQLTNRFLVVSNIRPEDPSAVIQGNERVVRPRLADAKFFFDQDRRKTLESRVAALDKVVYHAKLGTMGARATRVRAIAQAIARQLQAAPALAAHAERAALLAKADLLTDMVGEFPELQGVMGGYYARHDGESEEVAQAIEDHYKPRFAGDALPRGDVAVVVALADKLETLAGMFRIEQTPTGDKDPFALRRQALGVARLLMERAPSLGLSKVVEFAVEAFPDDVGPTGRSPADTAAVARLNLEQFVRDRLQAAFKERNYTFQQIDAVLSTDPDKLADVPHRIEAVRLFSALPESDSLAAANKRVGNILRKSAAGDFLEVDAGLFVEKAERDLHQFIQTVGRKADALFEKGDFHGSLSELAALKAPVDAFFDHVMVNADDPKLRTNRLALLRSLDQTMNRVADLSRLAA